MSKPKSVMTSKRKLIKFPSSISKPHPLPHSSRFRSPFIAENEFGLRTGAPFQISGPKKLREKIKLPQLQGNSFKRNQRRRAITHCFEWLTRWKRINSWIALTWWDDHVGFQKTCFAFVRHQSWNQVQTKDSDLSFTSHLVAGAIYNLFFLFKSFFKLTF